MRAPPSSKRTYTPVPYTPRFRSAGFRSTLKCVGGEVTGRRKDGPGHVLVAIGPLARQVWLPVLAVGCPVSCVALNVDVANENDLQLSADVDMGRRNLQRGTS